MTDETSLLDDDGWVEYTTGNPKFHGRTTVRIESDGRTTVRFERGEDTREFVDHLSEEHLSSVTETLAAHDPREIASTRGTGQPDEARIQLRFPVESEVRHREFWSNEQWEIEDLRVLVEQFQEVAAAVSDGEVTY